MSNNRDKLKQLAKGYSDLTGSDIGFDIDLWQYLDSGEYNKRAVEACIGLLRWVQTGERDNRPPERFLSVYSTIKKSRL